MSKKPDEYFWRGSEGGGWSRRESQTGEQSGLCQTHGTDKRIEEDIREVLTEYMDPTCVEVAVQGGEITLSGTVNSRQQRQLVEDVACAVSGVRELSNQIRIRVRKAS